MLTVQLTLLYLLSGLDTACTRPPKYCELRKSCTSQSLLAPRDHSSLGTLGGARFPPSLVGSKQNKQSGKEMSHKSSISWPDGCSP